MSSGGGLPKGVQVFERGWLSSNNILCIGAGPSTLIDSGYHTHAGQTLALVEQGLGGRPLDRLLNTHLHSDHCGGNAALQARYPRLTTWIPPGEAAAVAAWDPARLSFEATGQQCRRFHHDGILQPGSSVGAGDVTWEVHAAPGHDPHSVILFEPATKTLISADALWENGFGVVFQELQGEPAFDEVAQTLDLIERLAPRILIPGHGCVFTNVAPALERARRRLDRNRSDPTRHAEHALKVLLKFKLLEQQSMSWSALDVWVGSTPYFELVRGSFFAGSSVVELAREAAKQLVASGAARSTGEALYNA